MPQPPSSRTAVIIGAGPAGLTAAYELLDRAGITPVVLERSSHMGGISRTVNYKGNRIDIGGHRFFSKSDRVMEWWSRFLPLEARAEASERIRYRNQEREITAPGAGPDPDREDLVMLVRERRSRIYYLRQFFPYPLTLSAEVLRKLGPIRTLKIGFSYLTAALFPVKPERTLEDFFINRFGRELYRTFFQSYTEKVWGVPCERISAEWGAQRVKGLSVWETLRHAAKKILRPGPGDLAQKGVTTSLIERFLYPKLGPGQLWEEVARQVGERGGAILTGWQVDRIEHDPAGRVEAVWATHADSGEQRAFRGDYYFSTMAIQDLAAAMTPPPPPAVAAIAAGLEYRDFITVGILCRRLFPQDPALRGTPGIRDNWIYIQEPDVRVGRLQVFNNWSPYLVADPNTAWIGLEYFCNEGDELWRQSDRELLDLAVRELALMQMAAPEDILDGTVIRMPKTYPAYFGSYERFQEIIAWADGYHNLFLIGRNGMHKYNNQDHSMLTAMTAVDNLVAGVRDRGNLWSLNTEQEYHEEKDSSEG